MKTFKRLLPLLLLICSFAVIFSACAEDPYKDYVSSGLEPKTKIEHSDDKDVYKWYNDTDLKMFMSFAEYNEFEIDLGYTEGYFEQNSILIFLSTGNSSANIKFVDVLVKDGKLRPVLESNYIGPYDPVTGDVIYYVFYVEIPNSGNYTVGEIIYKTREENVTL